MSDSPRGFGTLRLRRMHGRDPHERHRVATSLELLFDLTFVIAFSEAGNAFAHLVSEGHVGVAVLGFVFSVFAVCWGWVNFSWFASAYDTDDWIFRLVTMLQMIGVLIVAMGLPSLFHSLDEGAHADLHTIVLGYVVMRVPMIFQWLRAAHQDPARRATALTYAVSVAVAQVGWVMAMLLDVSIATSMAISVALIGVELLGPYLAESKLATPWHAHHIAERYALMAIITLGECLIGTIASISAEVDHHGWTLDAALVALAGTLLTFGMWWTYTFLPSGEILHHARHKSFRWGYGHIFLFGSIAATGAGLHVAAVFLRGDGHLSAFAAVLVVVVPCALFGVTLGGLYTLLMGRSALHTRVKIATFVLYAIVVGLAAGGVSMPICLLVLAIAPLFTIVADELSGAAQRAEALERLARDPHGHRATNASQSLAEGGSAESTGTGSATRS